MDTGDEPSAQWCPPAVQWVVKATKFCNLRCRYCYEFPSLDDPRHMQPDELARMFENIGDAFAGCGRRMDFVWHGGEPLLLGEAFYRQVRELQEAHLTPRGVRFTNSVQTNLRSLKEPHLALLEGFFDHVGVSLDVFGDQRVDRRGQPVQDAILRNMQTLLDRGIRFGCITVLSRANVAQIASIYDFFLEIDTSFRLLPIYRTGYAGQQDGLALHPHEIVAAYRVAVDRWMSSSSSIQVRPIQDYITNVVRWLDRSRRRTRLYDKRGGEVVYIVDTDGSLYSNADAYDPTLRHGNLFSDRLGDMKASAGYLRALAAAEQRMQQACSGCRYHGACSGYFCGEATPEQRHLDDQGRMGCAVAQPIQAYIEQVLYETGLADPVQGLRDADALARLGASLQDTDEALVT